MQPIPKQPGETTGVPSVEVLGVHEVRAREPCHLLELVVHGNKGPIDMESFTQALPGKPKAEWQVPYDDRFLSADGTTIIGDVMLDGDSQPELWVGDVRMAFFLHYLDTSQPLLTPVGPVSLPAPTPRPKRLQIMEYAAVD